MALGHRRLLRPEGCRNKVYLKCIHRTTRFDTIASQVHASAARALKGIALHWLLLWGTDMLERSHDHCDFIDFSSIAEAKLAGDHDGNERENHQWGIM
jgi:hypothetical protein